MKPIIINMSEMSLSKEVYDKKPALFFTIFIYGLFALVLTALAWAYFGRLDIVVRSHGIIRPNAQTAVIINAVGGEARGVYYYEGKRVAQGDVLFAIDTFHLENERLILAERLYNLNFELATLELFRDSLEVGENLLLGFNEEFGARFDSFMVNIEAFEHNAESQLDLIEETVQGLERSLDYAHFELQTLRAFENSVMRGQDMFGAVGLSGRNREVRNTFRNQFARFALEMESLQLQKGVAEGALEGYALIRASVTEGENQFPEGAAGVYVGMYDEFTMQMMVLEENHRLAYDNHAVYAALYATGARSYMEVQQAATRLDNAVVALAEFESGFMLSLNNSIRTEENRLAQLINQSETLHVGNLANINSQMLALENSILEMNRSLSQAELQRGSMFFVGYESGDATMLRLGELNLTLGQINTTGQEISRLELSMEGIEAQINDSTVRAPIDGLVTVHTELTQGGFIPGGVHVLSIIPTREDMLNANIFISNQDIGQITEGMTVRFDIAAMPRRDFGEITGEITRISTDIAADGGMQGFFVVESEIEDRVYHDSRGQGVNLRVGMGFEARVIVERQRVLFYLLDRLNLIIR